MFSEIRLEKSRNNYSTDMVCTFINSFLESFDCFGWHMFALWDCNWACIYSQMIVFVSS